MTTYHNLLAAVTLHTHCCSDPSCLYPLPFVNLVKAKLLLACSSTAEVLGDKTRSEDSTIGEDSYWLEIIDRDFSHKSQRIVLELPQLRQVKFGKAVSVNRTLSNRDVSSKAQVHYKSLQTCKFLSPQTWQHSRRSILYLNRPCALDLNMILKDETKSHKPREFNQDHCDLKLKQIHTILQCRDNCDALKSKWSSEKSEPWKVIGSYGPILSSTVCLMPPNSHDLGSHYNHKNPSESILKSMRIKSHRNSLLDAPHLSPRTYLFHS